MRCYTDEQNEYIKAIINTHGAAPIKTFELATHFTRFRNEFTTDISFSQFSAKYYDMKRKLYPPSHTQDYAKSSAAEKEVFRSIKELVNENKRLTQENKELKKSLRKLTVIRQAVENYQKNI